MKKPQKPLADGAVELIYNNIANLPHPDHGAMRLVYFGHSSEGQRRITRGVAEAIVMLLEANNYRIVPAEVEVPVAAVTE